MYKETYAESKEQILDEVILKEMDKSRTESMVLIRAQFVPSKSISIKDVVLTLVYAYFEGNESAMNIADQLELFKIDFLALADDFEGFKAAWLKEQEYYRGQDNE